MRSSRNGNRTSASIRSFRKEKFPSPATAGLSFQEETEVENRTCLAKSGFSCGRAI